MQDLTTHLEAIQALPLPTAIKAISDLAPHLTTSISTQGDRLISHFAYTGTAPLDDLGSFYLHCGKRCAEEKASFQTRLAHSALDPIFLILYRGAEEALEQAKKDGKVKRGSIFKRLKSLRGSLNEGCPHCAGHPAAVIPMGMAAGEALVFEGDEYRRIWGDAKRASGEDDGPFSGRWKTAKSLQASREEVEEALHRDVGDVQEQSML